MRHESHDQESQIAFRPERLLESCEDDADLARDVVEEFLASAPHMIGRLTDAVESEDAARVRLEAHSLKGSCQTIGAEALAAVSAHLEGMARRGQVAEAATSLTRIGQEFDRLRPVLVTYAPG